MSRKTRFLLFILMIVIGLAGGLTYAWMIDPVQYENTSPDRLHPSYKADYVLMVAEIYQQDQDVNEAARQLAFLGRGEPATIAAEGLLTAREMNYATADLELMSQLTLALQGTAPTSLPEEASEEEGQP